MTRAGMQDYFLILQRDQQLAFSSNAVNIRLERALQYLHICWYVILQLYFSSQMEKAYDLFFDWSTLFFRAIAHITANLHEMVPWGHSLLQCKTL